jgi:hypothetical protein
MLHRCKSAFETDDVRDNTRINTLYRTSKELCAVLDADYIEFDQADQTNDDNSILDEHIRCTLDPKQRASFNDVCKLLSAANHALLPHNVREVYWTALCLSNLHEARAWQD